MDQLNVFEKSAGRDLDVAVAFESGELASVGIYLSDLVSIVRGAVEVEVLRALTLAQHMRIWKAVWLRSG
jgi:hypothetical protein